MHLAFLNLHGNFDPEDRYWTAHPDFGGQLVYVKEVSLALGRMGHHVDILTRRIVDPEWPGFESMLDGYPGEPNVRIVRIECGGLAFRRKQDLWPYIGTEWVPNIAAFYENEHSRPDAATSHYGDSGLAAALWHRQGGPRYTFTAHSLGAQKLDRLVQDNHGDLHALERDLFFARRIAAERVAMNHAARVITSTRQERNEQYSHPAYQGAIDPQEDHRFALVPPGVSLKVFDAELNGPDDARVARYIDDMLERDLDPQRRGLPAVLCASRLEVKKNHLGLLRAFGESRQLQQAANLIMVVRGADDIRGGPDLKSEEQELLDELARAAGEYGLGGKISVFSLDSQTELAAAYRHLGPRGSVFALTAFYEPFGLAPLEAMAAGVPVVATRRGGPSETLLDAEDGTEYAVLIDPSDPGDIAQGLTRLLASREQWQRFRDRGRQRVLDRFTWERTAEGYVSVAEAIVNESYPSQPTLPIPAFFTQPTEANDFGVSDLKWLYGKPV